MGRCGALHQNWDNAAACPQVADTVLLPVFGKFSQQHCIRAEPVELAGADDQVVCNGFIREDGHMRHGNTSCSSDVVACDSGIV